MGRSALSALPRAGGTPRIRERVTRPRARFARGEWEALLTDLSGRGRRESLEKDALGLHSRSFVRRGQFPRTPRAEACPLPCQRRAVVALPPPARAPSQQQCPLVPAPDACHPRCSVLPQPFSPRPGITDP